MVSAVDVLLQACNKSHLPSRRHNLTQFNKALILITEFDSLPLAKAISYIKS